jgi:hypothetical protein
MKERPGSSPGRLVFRGENGSFWPACKVPDCPYLGFIGKDTGTTLIRLADWCRPGPVTCAYAMMYDGAGAVSNPGFVEALHI